MATIPALGQDKKKPAPKAPPHILLIVPLGTVPGKTTTLTIRGKSLDKATAVKVEGAKTKLVSKGNAPVPDKNPDKVGDTQVVAEVTLDAKQPDGTLNVVVVTPEGETKPHKLLVQTVVAEKEPNDGFSQPQAITLPVVIEGRIERPRDVDVFRFTGKKGQKLTAEVLAQRYGSPLDAMLTLYDAARQQVAFNDDLGPDTRDARLEVVLPADGEYYLSLIDAHDGGGPTHVYRLVVK